MLKRYLVVAAVSILLLAGCRSTQSNGIPGRALAADLVSDTIRHDGLRRRYHLQLPRNHNQQGLSPLVIVLHGGGGKADQVDRLMTNGTLSAAAQERSMLLAYPEGLRKQWNDGRVEILKGNKQRDDVGFISALIDKLVEEQQVDPKRVYVTGISNGGHMSFRLAMDLSDKIAAIAPVTAQVSKAISNKIPERPISVMIVNGTDDPLVPYDGGAIRLFKKGRSRGEVLSSEQSVQFFREHNGCDAKPVVSSSIDRDPNDKTSVVITKYGKCRDGKSVSLVSVIGGGHTWPGGYQYLRPRRVGRVSREINASDLILDFFLAH